MLLHLIADRRIALLALGDVRGRRTVPDVAANFHGRRTVQRILRTPQGTLLNVLRNVPARRSDEFRKYSE